MILLSCCPWPRIRNFTGKIIRHRTNFYEIHCTATYATNLRQLSLSFLVHFGSHASLKLEFWSYTKAIICIYQFYYNISLTERCHWCRWQRYAGDFMTIIFKNDFRWTSLMRASISENEKKRLKQLGESILNEAGFMYEDCLHWTSRGDLIKVWNWDFSICKL